MSERVLDAHAQEEMNRRVPGHMHGGILRWIEHGIPGGGFLEAVVRGDRAKARYRADSTNQAALPDIFWWFQCYAPPGCFGDADTVAEWAEHRGLSGLGEDSDVV